MKGKIFNAQEVQSLISGNKTQFREVILYFGKCPYQVGQKIFVKESFEIWDDGIVYCASNLACDPVAKWKPAQHMKQEHSRLTLLIKEIRVERLTDIEEDAIAEGVTSRPNCSGYNKREDGWSMDWSRVGKPSKWASNGETISEPDISFVTTKYAFGNYWNATHKKPEEKFDANPWVWVIDFEVVK